MNNHDIVKKLIGKIKPVGETNADNERYENLVQMCNLTENLLMDIDDLIAETNNMREFSIKRSHDYANKFMTKITDSFKPHTNP